MKTTRIILAPCALLPALALCARAAVPLEWTADVERPAPAQFAVMRGETARLSASLVRGGTPWDPAAEGATLFWQTNGMGEAWWTAPATVSGSVLSADFTPAMDPGAPMVTAFLGARDADGALYRAFATLRFIHAPGATPNALPLPTNSIDFATVQVENAPWATTGYVDAALAAATPADYAAVSNAAMSAVQTEADPLFAAWANTNSLLPHAASIASYYKPVRFTVENVRAEESTVLNNRVKFFGRTFMLPPGVDDLHDVGDGIFAMFTGPETAVLVRVNNGLDPDDNKDYVSSGEFGFDYGLDGWPSVVFLGQDYMIMTERSPVATAADVAAATNAIPAPDLSALPPAQDITLGGTNLVGLLPEYIAAPETVRTNVYTGVSRDTELRDGKLVLLYLATQPSGAFSLNLQLADGTWTGAKAVRFWGTSGASTQINAGSIIHIVYRGGAWYWSDRDTNTDTYDRVRINQEVRAASAIGRNSLCGAATNGTGYVKLAPGVVIDPAQPLLYLNKTSTLAAGSRDSNFYSVMGVGTALLSYHGVAGKQRSPLYLLGALSDDGRAFTVGDPAFSYEPEPPCLPLGLFHAATTNNFYFVPGPLILPPAVPATRKIAGVALDADIPLAGGLTVTNGALRVYDAAPDGTLSNLIWDSSSAADTATVADLARRVAALESGGGAASWADYDAQGNANPDSDIVMLNRAFTAIGSGFYWASSGGHYCLCSSGSVAYLADAGGSLRLFGSSISNYVGIVAGGTVTVGANADGFEVVGGVASITYPWSGGAHPTVYGAATLAGPWTEMTSAVWVDDADAGTATASFPADQTSFFFKATTVATLGERLESTLPAYFPGGVMTRANDLDPVIYDSTITITSGGHTYRIPAQLVQ